MRLSLDDAIEAERRDLDLVALDDALEGLAKIDPRQARLWNSGFLRAFRSRKGPKCSACLRRP